MPNRRTGAHGLPVFLRDELAAVKKEGSTAFLILDVAGKIKFGTTADPNRWVRNVACAAKAEVAVRFIGWAPDSPLARRIKGTAEQTLEGRRVGRDLYDVPLDLALGALSRAVDGIGVELRTTDTVLRSCMVREARELMGKHCVKVLLQRQAAQKREDRLLAAIMV